jgi:hypothetical protein
MPDLNLDRLHPVAMERVKPFFEEILDKYSEGVHSINVTGTSITEDYDPKLSDVNSIIILKKMDLKFLEVLAPLGKKYGKNKVAAPLIMTPEYIRNSLDVFPIEFLNFKLIHVTVFGEDVFNDIEIKLDDLRDQCERELKSKLIWLRQGYISSQGNRRILTEGFANSITGYIPLFRGITMLFGKEPPVKQEDVMKVLSEVTGANTDIFHKVYRIKRDRIKPSIEELNTIFEDFYHATERLGRIVDEFKI